MGFNKFVGTILLSIPALLAKAEEVTFKVLAVNGTPILNINGQQYQMEAGEYPQYKVKVNVDSFPVQYNYIVATDANNAVSEQFVRTRQKDEKALNEFFNRSLTVKKHPELPRAYEAFPYFEQSKLYDDSFVSTIIVTCDPAQLQALYADTEAKTKIPAVVVYASPYAVKTFKEAQFALSGQSTREVPKLSYKISNLKDGKKELYNRSSIKLRAEHMDYSYIRDKIYGDIVNSLGVPTAQNTFTRVFINGRDIGLFDLSDDITNNRYLRETFNKGEKFTAENPIYKADCDGLGGIYGELAYYGDDITNPNYAIYTYKGDDVTQDSTVHVAQDIIPLLKEIDAYKNGLAQSFSLDTESFLKSMAMEFLAGAVDNYWNKPGNYYLFKDTAKNLWYFHDADFHYSFGVDSDPDLMLNTPLAQYPPLFANENIRKDRAPLDALRSHPDVEAHFRDIIARLLKTSFNPSAIFPRIDSLADLIREDAEWDISIKPKENPNPTSELYLAENIDGFDIDTKSENPQGVPGGFSIKYYIKTRANNVANELQIQIPAQFESDLGTVVSPDANAKEMKGNVDDGDDKANGSIKINSWNMSLTVFLLLITLLFY